MACLPTNALPFAAPGSRRSSPTLKPGCDRKRARLSRHSEVAKAMDYMLKRWESFTRFLADGRICLTNNAAERELPASPSVARHGCLPASTAAASERP